MNKKGERRQRIAASNKKRNAEYDAWCKKYGWLSFQQWTNPKVREPIEHMASRV